jgi:hypothetical protein
VNYDVIKLLFYHPSASSNMFTNRSNLWHREHKFLTQATHLLWQRNLKRPRNYQLIEAQENIIQHNEEKKGKREKGNMKANTSFWHIQCIRRVEKERS